MGEEVTSLVGTTLDGRYSVVREIGRGAMGTVYEARHPLIGRHRRSLVNPGVPEPARHLRSRQLARAQRRRILSSALVLLALAAALLLYLLLTRPG